MPQSDQRNSVKNMVPEKAITDKATTKQKQPDQMPKYSFRSVPWHGNATVTSIRLTLMLVHTFFLAS